MPEGYTKFACRWTEEPIEMAPALLLALDRWRSELRRLGLVGATPDGVGFGNISARVGGSAFVITGSATGGLERLEPCHYALVDEARPRENWLSCRGLTRASSESLTHAAVYQSLPWAGGVIHVHSPALWERFAGTLPTTPAEAEYGTPEMAEAIATAVRAARSAGVVVMGGHRDGLLAFGGALDDAGAALLALRRRPERGSLDRRAAP
jgi:L-ribulose-5-phosphate 4-epimerase